MQTNLLRWIFSLLLGALLTVTGCTQAPNQTASAPPPAATPQAEVSPAATPAETTAKLDPQYATLPRLEGKAVVEMVVKGTPITMELDGINAPLTAGNFVDLVNRGLYNGSSFHRVVRQPQPFVVQGGDPQSKDPNFPAAQLGTGGFIDPNTGAERYIPLEIKPDGATAPIYGQTFQEAGVTQPPVLKHTRGAVAMARSQLPNSASSQFYITLADLSFLDGNYAVFGTVTSGMEMVDQIQQGDRIETARVVSGLENLRIRNDGDAPVAPAATPAAPAAQG